MEHRVDAQVKAPEWQNLGYDEAILVRGDGKVLARITREFGGLWVYAGDRYISAAAAQKAAEGDVL
jgi:hypothetical protein